MKNKKSTKLTKLQRSSVIQSNAKVSQWCYVNTDNEFKFMNKIFQIDEKVKEYKVHNKARLIDGELNDYTNNFHMEEILCVVDNEDKLNFYNQSYEPIDWKLVKIRD
jgi:hypothetical protein